MDGTIITTTAELEALCARLGQVPFITVDTEFIRERTYYPKLCLIQAAGDGIACAIDPLAAGLDLAPFLELLYRQDLLKVFHAARQDLEIFFHLTARVPSPVFDTQIAAQFAGFGESVSYSDFVQRMTGATIDKAARFTDWSRRPLTKRQLDYALSDVHHLAEAYLALKRQLETDGRLAWADEEMALLQNPLAYTVPPKEAWQRIKSGKLKPRQLAVLKELACWREEEAQKRDIPRVRVLRDETLTEIAAMMPQSGDELRHIRGSNGLSTSAVSQILTLIESVRRLPSDTLPASARWESRVSQPEILGLLQMLLAMQCRRHRILPRLVATREELEAMIEGREDVRPLREWRHDIFGEHAKRLLTGQLRLRYDPETGQVIFD